MKIAMIVAMDESGFIGKDGDLPWRMSSDLKRFRDLTTGDGFNAVVMGRKTWDSLPDSYRPLPERTNIVLSRDSSLQIDGAEIALYDGRAVEIGYSEGCDELWVIGGAEKKIRKAISQPSFVHMILKPWERIQLTAGK